MLRGCVGMGLRRAPESRRALARGWALGKGLRGQANGLAAGNFPLCGSAHVDTGLVDRHQRPNRLMDEIGIKAEVLTRIRRECKSRDLPTVTTEFSLNGTGIRADLALLGKTFHGIEIKSASDTLKRLPSQLEGYARYFDRITIVLASKHLKGIRKINLRGAEVLSREVIGDWQCRFAGKSDRVSGNILLGLLTAEEEKRAVRGIMRSDGSVTSQDARAAFIEAFNRRYKETSDIFWKAVHGREIRREDIPMLSRYFSERQMVIDSQAAQESEWQNWASKMAAVAGATAIA